jgi:hypothetical protein
LKKGLITTIDNCKFFKDNYHTEDLSKKSSALMESYREIKVELLGE